MPAIEYLRGDHYVIASGDMVALCDARTPSTVVAQLYAAVNDGGLDAPRVMQSVLDIDMTSVPSLAVVTEGEKHWHVLVRGDAHVDVLTLDETWTVDAPGVLTWSESTIEEADGFILRFASAVPEQGDVYPLEGGIVAGECAFLPVTEHARAAMAAAEAASAAPAPAAAPAVSAAQSVSAQQARLRAAAVAEETRMAPPVAPAPSQPAPYGQAPSAAPAGVPTGPGQAVPAGLDERSGPYIDEYVDAGSRWVAEPVAPASPWNEAAATPTAFGASSQLGAGLEPDVHLSQPLQPAMGGYARGYGQSAGQVMAAPQLGAPAAVAPSVAAPSVAAPSVAAPSAAVPSMVAPAVGQQAVGEPALVEPQPIGHSQPYQAAPAHVLPSAYSQPGPYAQPDAAAGQAPAASAPRGDSRPFDTMTLVLSSGSVVALDRPVVLGRAPQQSAVPDVINPRLVPFIRASDEVSRTHLLIERSADEVFATDLGSRNGTMVVPAGAQPYRLGAGERARVALGTRLDLGDGSIATLEAAR